MKPLELLHRKRVRFAPSHDGLDRLKLRSNASEERDGDPGAEITGQWFDQKLRRRRAAGEHRARQRRRARSRMRAELRRIVSAVEMDPDKSSDQPTESSTTTKE